MMRCPSSRKYSVALARVSRYIGREPEQRMISSEEGFNHNRGDTYKKGLKPYQGGYIQKGTFAAADASQAEMAVWSAKVNAKRRARLCPARC